MEVCVCRPSHLPVGRARGQLTLSTHTLSFRFSSKSFSFQNENEFMPKWVCQLEVIFILQKVISQYDFCEMSPDSFCKMKMKMLKWKWTHFKMKMKWVLPAGDPKMTFAKWVWFHFKMEPKSFQNELGLKKSNSHFAEWNWNDFVAPTLSLWKIGR